MINRKIITLFLAAMMFLILSSSAQASVFFIDRMNFDYDVYLTAGDTYDFAFDLDNDVLEAGYMQPDFEILNAELTLNFMDYLNGEGTEPLLITLDNAFSYSEEIDYALYFDVTSYLQDDHNLSVQIEAHDGSFVLCGANVQGNAAESSCPVPEPATMALLAPALLGLLGLKRKKA